MKNLGIFDNNPIFTTNELHNIYECPKKLPLNSLHWKFHVLAAFVKIHINSDDGFFLFVYHNVCMLPYISRTIKAFHMRFSAKALYTFRACLKKIKFYFRSPEVVEITHYFHQYAQKWWKSPKNWPLNKIWKT